MNKNEALQKCKAGSALRLSAFLIDLIIIGIITAFGFNIVNNLFLSDTKEYTEDASGNTLAYDEFIAEYPTFTELFPNVASSHPEFATTVDNYVSNITVLTTDFVTDYTTINDDFMDEYNTLYATYSQKVSEIDADETSDAYKIAVAQLDEEYFSNNTNNSKYELLVQEYYDNDDSYYNVLKTKFDDDFNVLSNDFNEDIANYGFFQTYSLTKYFVAIVKVQANEFSSTYTEIERAYSDGEITKNIYHIKSEVNTVTNEVSASAYYEYYIKYALAITYYFLIIIPLLLTIYTIALNGKTVGRRLFRISLIGKTSKMNLILRELLLKYVYWYATIGVGAVIDFFMATFSKDKLTIRDLITKTNVVTNSYFLYDASNNKKTVIDATVKEIKK